jgi:hypothetical protein
MGLLQAGEILIEKLRCIVTNMQLSLSRQQQQQHQHQCLGSAQCFLPNVRDLVQEFQGISAAVKAIQGHVLYASSSENLTQLCQVQRRRQLLEFQQLMEEFTAVASEQLMTTTVTFDT